MNKTIMIFINCVIVNLISPSHEFKKLNHEFRLCNKA